MTAPTCTTPGCQNPTTLTRWHDGTPVCRACQAEADHVLSGVPAALLAQLPTLPTTSAGDRAGLEVITTEAA